MKTYPIKPNTKPRATRSDKWKQRPCILQYRAFKDEVRLHGVTLPDCPQIVFVLPMAKSWSKKKRAEMNGKPHKQTPDIDNLAKALFDALYKDDSHIWDCRLTKIWGHEGEIRIE